MMSKKLAADKSIEPNATNEIGHFALGDSFAQIILRNGLCVIMD
jgi:hypothetical protein